MPPRKEKTQVNEVKEKTQVNEDSKVSMLEENINLRFDDLKNDIAALREQVIKNLVDENLRLQEKVVFLEKRLNLTESDTYSLQQYSRRNNIEISGIPETVTDNDLEQKVIEILDCIDVNVDSRDIETCHRLPSKTSPKTTIIKFVNRKVCEEAHPNKKKLDSCDKSSIGISDDVKIYINENLCPYYKKLAWKCRVLRREKVVINNWTRNGIVHIRISEGDKYKKIFHESDLTALFPDFEFDE